MKQATPVAQATIFRFWAPLALTWLMMSAEGPVIAAFVARLPEAKPNLAAFGVAIAIAILVEAPVIMIMSAATALARDRVAYLRLRNFTNLLNLGITVLMALLLFTPGMGIILSRLIGLAPELVERTETALIILLPWPAAIGVRRFYNGVVIRHGQTRRVTCCTVVRLVTMALTCLLLYRRGDVPGAYVGAAALSLGVTLEAVAAWLLAGPARRALLHREGEGIGWGEIVHFYYPLALTAIIALAVHPMVTFLVGGARHPLESLAVIPVVNSFIFVFRSMGLSYQEVVIALAGDGLAHIRAIRRFALTLGLATTAVLGLIAFTPLAGIWFERVAGLRPDLVEYTRVPVMLMAAFPALSVLISYQRGLLVKVGRTGPVTWASLIEVGFTVAVIWVGIHRFGLVGATAAAAGLVAGRLVSNTYLAVESRLQGTVR